MCKHISVIRVNEYSIANNHQSLKVHQTSIYLQHFDPEGPSSSNTILGTHNETSNTQVATFIQGMIVS